MILLLLFSLMAGIVTILSPCILPILPIVLSSSFAGGKERPFGIVTGFILSFTFFTLFLTTIVKLLGIPADLLRLFSVFVIFFFGISLLLPKVQIFLEKSFAYFSRFVPRSEKKEGFSGGLLVGLSIGLLWTPCVGPILASVISLALTGSVTLEAFFITLAYSFGTALPMLLILFGGQRVLTNNQWLLKNSMKIQKIFGIVMMLTAIAIYFNLDRRFQSYILEKFPNYGSGLTKFEDSESVSERLNKLNANPEKEDRGKITSDLINKSLTAPELIKRGEWFNLPAEKENLTIKELRGKVVLVDFWTYTCINCIRTLPYLKNWHDKYTDEGLVIIGVHTPEFEFEKDPVNVEKAIKDFEIQYPVMQDNNYETWEAYNNRYWPAKYLIDKEGKIRYTHFGEGDYDQTEKAIQQLLKEAGSEIKDSINNPSYRLNSGTPELYLGYARIEYLLPQQKIIWDKSVTFEKPALRNGTFAELPDNHFAFEGSWNLSPEYAAPGKGSKLYLNFEAKDVFLVMRTKDGKEGRVKVIPDKTMSGNYSYWGEDAVGGEAVVREDRLYKLLKFEQSERTDLILEFLDDNLELYAFTFG